MSEENNNPNFDVNSKYQDMIKTSEMIVDKYQCIIDKGYEPSIYVSLAHDVKNYLPKLLKENQELKEQNQKYKEVIDKAIEWIKKKINSCTIEAESTTKDTMCKITISGLYNLLEILKEVE